MMSQPLEHNRLYLIENTLVAQKDRILRFIAAGQPDEAITALEVVADLWKACDYAYKIREVAVRIIEQFPDTRHESGARLMVSCLDYIERLEQ